MFKCFLYLFKTLQVHIDALVRCIDFQSAWNRFLKMCHNAADNQRSGRSTIVSHTHDVTAHSLDVEAHAYIRKESGRLI